MKEKALVLFSGGMDSTVCLLLAIKEFGCENVIALSFTYNHLYRSDITAAKKICEKFKINHKIFDLGVLYELSKSNNVEGRNLILISLAAIYAMNNECNKVYVGVTDDDTHIDCSKKFIEVLEKTIHEGVTSKIKLITPLLNLNKKGIWELADKLGYLEFVKEETFSCWQSNSTKHCLLCKSCQARYNGLKAYETQKNKNEAKI